MSTKSGGQLESFPNRKSGSKPCGGESYGQITPRGGNPSGKHGQQHVTPGGPGQGGSGSARKSKK